MEASAESPVSELDSLRQELATFKLAASLSEESKDEMKRKYENEIASLQRVLKEAVAETIHSDEREARKLRQHNRMLDLQLNDLRMQISGQQEGFVSSILRTLKLSSSLGNTAAAPQDGCAFKSLSNLSEEQIEQLQPVLVPFEQELLTMKAELVATKQELQETKGKLQAYAGKLSQNSASPAGIFSEQDLQQFCELQYATDAEERSIATTRDDLKIYLAVMNTQKQVLQDDVAKLQKQLADLHAATSTTQKITDALVQHGGQLTEWLAKQISPDESPANHSIDGGVESQPEEAASKPLCFDTNSSVQCNAEGAKTKPSLSQLAAFRLQLDNLVASLALVSKLATAEDLCIDAAPAVVTGLDDTVSDNTMADDSVLKSKRSVSLVSGLNSKNITSAPLIIERRVRDVKTQDGADLLCVETAPNANDCANTSSSARQYSPSPSATSLDENNGGLLFASYESSTSSSYAMPTKPHQSRSSLSLRQDATSCDMCTNYEHKLQQAQEAERNLSQQLRSSQALTERYKAELSREREFRADLEAKSKIVADEASANVTAMFQHVSRLQDSLSEEKRGHAMAIETCQTQAAEVIEAHDELQREFDKLQALYDKLLGKHRQQAELMRNEMIDFPDNSEELQLLCLKFREELIEQKAAKEHLENVRDNLKSELMFARDQMQSDQVAKEKFEDSLTEEVNTLRTQLGLSQSKAIQLQEELKRYDSLKSTLKQGQEELSVALAQKDAAQAEVKDLKRRLIALQHDLDSSAAVSQDFVRLSQSLQVELEKIRQDTKEVRWQLADDCVICSGCRQAFTAKLKKQRCYHCCKIYCGSCVEKTVPCGPQKRPVPVCSVCHTILCSDTAPYFSNEVPDNVS